MIHLDPRPPVAFFGGHLPGSLSASGPLGRAFAEALAEAAEDGGGGTSLKAHWVTPAEIVQAATEGTPLVTVGEITPLELRDREAAGTPMRVVGADRIPLAELVELLERGGPTEEQPGHAEGVEGVTAAGGAGPMRKARILEAADAPLDPDPTDAPIDVVVGGVDPARQALVASLLLATGTPRVRVLVEEAP